MGRQGTATPGEQAGGRGAGHAGSLSSMAFYLVDPRQVFADLISDSEPTSRLGLVSKNLGFAICF